MELDDIKGAWSRDSFSTMNPNIKEVLRQKDYGPVAALKKQFLIRLIVTGMITCNLTYKNSVDFNNDILMWVFIGFCCLLEGYYYYNYNLLDDLQSFYKPVSINIKEQINILDRGAIFFRIIMQALPIVFAILLEVLLYKGQEPFFNYWYILPFKFRVFCYIAVIMLFYALKKYTHERNFDRHIRYLKEVAKQL